MHVPRGSSFPLKISWALMEHGKKVSNVLAEDSICSLGVAVRHGFLEHSGRRLPPTAGWLHGKRRSVEGARESARDDENQMRTRVSRSFTVFLSLQYTVCRGRARGADITLLGVQPACTALSCICTVICTAGREPFVAAAHRTQPTEHNKSLANITSSRLILHITTTRRR